MMRSPIELQELAWRALVKELGLADALRYRILFQQGSGDYCRERQALFPGVTLEGWLKDLAAWDKRRTAG
jgi:hypothetical protein